MNGGQPGAKGLNVWLRRDRSSISVGGKCTVNADSGDRFIIQTPGGEGWGREGDVNIQSKVQTRNKPTIVGNGRVGGSMRDAETN